LALSRGGHYWRTQRQGLLLLLLLLLWTDSL
jgi:hypothetical protein